MPDFAKRFLNMKVIALSWPRVTLFQIETGSWQDRVWRVLGREMRAELRQAGQRVRQVPVASGSWQLAVGSVASGRGMEGGG